MATDTLRFPAVTRPLVGPVPAVVALFVLSRLAALIGMLIAKDGDLGQAFVALAGSYDASWYERVVFGGYGQSNPDPTVAVFYPGYPFLASLFFHPLSWLFRLLDSTGHLLSAAGLPILVFSMLAASNVAMVVALIALWKLFQPLLGEAATVIGTGLLLASPGGFFLTAGFSESTFIATTALAFLAAVRGRWVLAGLAGAAACLTRSTGPLLLIPLVILWWEMGNRGPSLAAATGLVMFAVGAAAYPIYVWLNFHDPLFYVHLQARGWHHHLSNPLRMIARSLHLGYRGLKAVAGLPSVVRIQDAWVVIADAVLVAWSVITVGIGWLRLPVSQLVWVALMVLAPLSTGLTDSMNRYLLSAWPMFYLGGWLLRRQPVLAAVLIVGSGAWMLALAYHIAQGWFVA